MQPRPRFGMLVLTASLFVGLFGAAALVAVRNYRGAHSMLEADPPSALLKDAAAAGIEGLEPVSIPFGGLKVAAWYVPPRHAAAVVIAHGTNSDRASMLSEIRILADAGIGVLAFDWPGLGQSEGQIQWGRQAHDALRAAVDWLAARPEVDAQRIGGLGFSMGGYELAQVAAQDQRLRAIVLESSPDDFDSYEDVHYSKWGILGRWPSRWAIKDAGLFSKDTALTAMPKLTSRPVFIIGQTEDPEIPLSMTKALADAAGEPKQVWLIEGDEHGSYAEVAGIEYAQRLKRFFEANLLDSAVAKGP